MHSPSPDLHHSWALDKATHYHNPALWLLVMFDVISPWAVAKHRSTIAVFGLN